MTEPKGEAFLALTAHQEPAIISLEQILCVDDNDPVMKAFTQNRKAVVELPTHRGNPLAATA